MKQHKMRRLAAGAVLAVMSVSVSAQTVQDLINSCLAAQKVRSADTQQTYIDMTNTNPTLNAIAKKPVSTGGDFSCYADTKDTFNSMLSAASGLFGDYGPLFTSLFSSTATSATNQLCGAVRKAVADTYGTICPSGMTCSAGLNGASVGLGSYGSFSTTGTSGTYTPPSTIPTTSIPTSTIPTGTLPTTTTTTTWSNMACMFLPSSCPAN